MGKAASKLHTGYLAECPVPQAELKTYLAQTLSIANALNRRTLEYLEGRESDEERARWISSAMRACETLFQPWMMEIVYVLAIHERARFSELQQQLGLSSRTLSDKLKLLREEGFVDRQVYDEQPVRIEYFLTKHGSKTAAFVAPLTAYLNAHRREQAKA